MSRPRPLLEHPLGRPTPGPKGGFEATFVNASHLPSAHIKGRWQQHERIVLRQDEELMCGTYGAVNVVAALTLRVWALILARLLARMATVCCTDMQVTFEVSIIVTSRSFKIHC